MRVLHIQKSAGIGGSERHLLDLLPGLADRGVDVRAVVMTARGADKFVNPLRDAGIDTLELPAGRDANPGVVIRLMRLIRSVDPDLIHTHLVHADLHGQLAARLCGVPAVSTLHSTQRFYLRRPYRDAVRLAWLGARYTIAISEFAAEFARQEKLVRPARIRVVYYGVDVDDWQRDDSMRQELRSSWGVSEDDVVVGMSSRLIQHKGHETVVRAVAKARRSAPGLKLVIAGEGPLVAELTGLLPSVLPDGGATLVGFVDDVSGFLGACDMVAFATLPELSEGFGLAALEAMAAGRAVVASAMGPLGEIVAHNVTGLLAAPGDVDEWADALASLAIDERARDRFGVAGRERARTKFSLESMIDRTLAVYGEVLAV